METTWDSFESRQHINISSKSYNLLINDVQSYHLKTLSALVNRIIVYDNTSHISSVLLDSNPVSLINHKAKELDEILAFNTYDDIIVKNIKNTIIEHTIKDIQKKYCSPTHGIQLKVHLNTKAMDCLSQTDSLIINTYQKRGKYIAALLESFCSLTQENKELIIKDDIYTQLIIGINTNHTLRLRTSLQMDFLVKPFTIQSDLNHQYLVCMSKLISSSEESDYIPASFRLDKITSITQTFYSSDLSPNEKNHLTDRIEQNGVAYVLDKLVPIKVHLTTQGLSMYYSISHLRPIGNIKDNTFSGLCTMRQAQNYFSKFGKEAIVLEPKQLHLTIMQEHEYAYLAYKEEFYSK